jgi:hypothetical protein
LEEKTIQPLPESACCAIEYAREYIDSFSKDNTKNNLLLIGPLTIGSRIAAAILNDLITERNVVCHYYEWKQLITEYGRAQDEEDIELENTIYSSIKAPKVVVLNGLGTTHPTEVAWDRMNTLFNTRYAACLPMIATTTYWNYPITGPDKRGIKYPGYYAKRFTLADQIGERARSRITESSAIIQFNEVDPYPLRDILTLCETTSAVKGWRLPILVERARGCYSPADEVRFDDYGNAYLHCDDYSSSITNLDLYLKIKSHFNRHGILLVLEAAAYIQPVKVWSTRYNDFLPVTGGLISDAGTSGGPKLILSPFSNEIPRIPA